MIKTNSRDQPIKFSTAEGEQLARDEDVSAVSKSLITKNKQAYEELAK
ncbi:MAG: hypothetical protein LUG49_08845 [Oscillospiraceae bacterium]|nr:hypothetical protein [Oscillospiraceae bacterium]